MFKLLVLCLTLWACGPAIEAREFGDEKQTVELLMGVSFPEHSVYLLPQAYVVRACRADVMGCFRVRSRVYEIVVRDDLVEDQTRRVVLHEYVHFGLELLALPDENHESPLFKVVEAL